MTTTRYDRGELKGLWVDVEIPQKHFTTHNIKKPFGDIEAVRGVNLKVYPGEAFGLLGPNGAGKTTI